MELRNHSDRDSGLTPKRRHFPSFLKRFCFRKCDIILQESESSFKTYTGHLFLGDIWKKFLCQRWNFDNTPWIEQNQGKTDFSYLYTLCCWSLEVSGFITSAGLLHSCYTVCFCLVSSSEKLFYQTVVLANYHPAVLGSITASVPIVLPKLWVLPNLSTLLDLIPQVEAHLIVHSGYKSWQPSWYHT